MCWQLKSHDTYTFLHLHKALCRTHDVNRQTSSTYNNMVSLSPPIVRTSPLGPLPLDDTRPKTKVIHWRRLSPTPKKHLLLQQTARLRFQRDSYTSICIKDTFRNLLLSTVTIITRYSTTIVHSLLSFGKKDIKTQKRSWQHCVQVSQYVIIESQKLKAKYLLAHLDHF
jgi:hypothetical protein